MALIFFVTCDVGFLPFTGLGCIVLLVAALGALAGLARLLCRIIHGCSFVMLGLFWGHPNLFGH